MGKQSQQQAPSFTVSSVNSNLYFILIKCGYWLLTLTEKEKLYRIQRRREKE